MNAPICNAADEAAVKEGCYFDEAAAERVRLFFRTFLRHSKGEWGGQPFELLDWQWQDLIRPLFGWKRADGTRRFRRAYIEIPKKNGKSTLASGVGLYLEVGDGEPGAEVYSCAADREQAGIVHGEAIRMVDASPGLTKVLHINRSTHTIYFPRKKSLYRALSAEAETKEGLNAHGLIIDELHAWRGRKLWDTLRYAGRARRQPLLFVITTAGDDVHSVCYEQHEYALGILRGNIVDTRFFAYIRAAEPDDDWVKPETWHKANPSLGYTIKEDDFAADVREAEKLPSTISTFKRYSLNIWATSTNPWLRATDWSQCKRDFTEEDLAGRRCYAGLDLSSTRDLTALALVFPWDTDLFRVLTYFWLPEATIYDKDSPEEYRVWQRRGCLRDTQGSVCDYSCVKRDVLQLSERFRIQELAYDPWNAEKTAQEIEEESGIKRTSFPQTISNFAGPVKEFERLVVSGRINHNGHPVMDWMAGHVQVKSDPNNNKRPVKPPDNDRRKIDGVVAAVMALGLALKDSDGPSIYETQGIMTI